VNLLHGSAASPSGTFAARRSCVVLAARLHQIRLLYRTVT
jgi:hypothetical protein